MTKLLFTKLFIIALLFSVSSCGTPTDRETTTQTDPNMEVQKAVNAEANTDQENSEYAEKQEATNQAIAFYDALKNGMYENTTSMVEPTMYKEFSEVTWLEMLKEQAQTKGEIEKYSLQTSKYEIVEGTNSGRKVEMIFEITRKGQKYIEEMEWYKTDGEPFMLTEMEYKEMKNTAEDND